MIEVTLDGYRYYYHKAEGKGHWLGFGGYKGSLSRMAHCSVPTSMWRELKQEALKNGCKEEDFVPKVVADEKTKSASSREKKNNKKVISIF